MTSVFDSIHFTSETIYPSAGSRLSRSVTSAATIYDDTDSSPKRTIVFIYEPSDSESEEDGQLMAYSTEPSESSLVEMGSIRIPKGHAASISVTPRFVKDTAILLLFRADGSAILRYQVVWHPERQQIIFTEERSFAPRPTSASSANYEGGTLQIHPYHRLVALVNTYPTESLLQLVALLPSDGSCGETTKLINTIALENCHCNCVSWSPNGEHLAISSNSYALGGSEEGEANVKLYRYEPKNTNEILQLVASVPKQCSAEEDDASDSWKCTFVHWFDRFSLMVGYNTITEDEDESPIASLHIWDLEETSLQVLSSTDLGDVIPFFDIPKGQQHTFYASNLAEGILENELPILLVFVAANVGNDIALIGKESSSSAWSILEMEDSGLSTPVNEDDDFSFPTGIVLMSTGQLSLVATDASLSLYSPPHELSMSLFPSTPFSAEPTWGALLDSPTNVRASFTEAEGRNSVLDITEISDDEPPDMLDEPEDQGAVTEPDTTISFPAPTSSVSLSPSLLSSPLSPTSDIPRVLPSSVDSSTDAVVVTGPIAAQKVLTTSATKILEQTTPHVAVLPAAISDEAAPPKFSSPDTEMSELATKAAAVFDELDKEKSGFLPSHFMEELLDALGEGFHGSELDYQVAIIDPESRGILDRNDFIAWYERLSNPQPRNDDEGSEASSSMDSEEEAEREEEREKARSAFEMISSDEGATIHVSDFPALIEALNTTYCDEDHGKVSRKLRKDDKIYIDDFLNWYVDWIFGGDESTEEDDESTTSPVEAVVSGWGNAFVPKAGSWKCESCMVLNDANATECAACTSLRPSLQGKDSAAESLSNKVTAGGWGDIFSPKIGSWKCESCMVTNESEKMECVSCSEPRPGSIKPSESIVGSNAPTIASAVGTGGFFFGAVPAVGAGIGASETSNLENPMSNAFSGAAANEQSTGSSFSFPSVGSGGFSFGTQPIAVSSISAGGFSFGTGSGQLDSSIDSGQKAEATIEKVDGNEDSNKEADGVKTSFQFSSLLLPQQSSQTTAKTEFVAALQISNEAPPSIKPTGKTAAAFPPMSKTAPTPVSMPQGTKTAPVAAALSIEPVEGKKAAAFPPMSRNAPAPISIHQATKAAPVEKKAAAFPSISRNAPTPFSIPHATKTAPAAGVPSISLEPYSSFGSTEKKAAAAAFPPMSFKAPAPVSIPQAIKKAPENASLPFPPAARQAPTPLTSSFSTASAPIPTTTPVFSKRGQFDGFQSTSANSPNKMQFPSASSINTPVQPSFTGSATAQSVPRVLGYATADVKEEANLTDCSLQYANLIDHMQKSLEVLATYRPAVSDADVLRHEIEHHVKTVTATQFDLVGVIRSLEEGKGLAANVLGRKAEATRNVSESQRLIDEMSSPGHSTFDDFSTEPLDFQTETRRRKLSAKFMITKRLVEIAKSRLDLVSAMATSQAGNVLLSSTLSSYNDVKSFNEAASKIEQKVTEIASTQIQSSTTEAISIVPRQSAMNSFRVDKISSLKTMEKTIQNLQAPTVKVFDLNNAIWRNENSAGLSSLHTMPMVTRGSHSSVRLFSPTIPLTARDGWTIPSSVNQRKMKQVSFSSPVELRDTTLSFSSREALAEFGTNPDEVQGLLTVNKRGMPLDPGRAAPSLETFVKRNVSPLKRPTVPVPLNSEGFEISLSQDNFSSSHASGRESSLRDETDAIGKSTENSVAGLSLSSTPKRGNVLPPREAPSNHSGSSSLGNAPSFPSTHMQQFSSSPKEVHSSEITLNAEESDYLRILTRFYEQHNPDKVFEAESHLQKYKGREQSLFAKLAKKYNAANPLDELQQTSKSEGQSSFQAFSSMTDDSAAFMESADRGNAGTSPFTMQTQRQGLDHISSVPSHGITTSSFGSPLSMTNPPLTMPPSSQTGPSTTFSTFAQGPDSAAVPQGNALGSNPLPTSMFGGKSPRELLTAFYQEKNPSKIADVETLLIKYQGREEEMFRNLAKKYNLDPTVFGLSASTGPSLFASPPGIAPSPLAFGQSTPLGGGGAFGMGSPPAPSFGSGSGGFGQTFGSAAGASSFGSTSFGALANAPVQPSFGGLATSHRSGLSSPLFGSPTPFGAPRR